MRRHVVTISKKNERTDLLNKTNMKKNNRIKTLFDPLVGFNRCDFLQRCFSTSGVKFNRPSQLCINSTSKNIVFEEGKAVFMLPPLKPFL